MKKFLSMDGVLDKLAVIWKGPSWFPGMPRLGLDDYKVNVSKAFHEEILLLGVPSLDNWL